MNGRKKRIKQWISILIISALLLGGAQLIKYIESKPEKQKLTVCAPLDMKDAFVQAFNVSGLSESHEIYISNNLNSNICVAYSKQGDASYQKFAYSPFIVAYGTDDSYFKKLKKSNICVESPYEEDYYEIDFLEVINEVIGDGKWANLGIEELDKIKVFYPDKESIYWNDFYDFMLVTLNDGIYPENESEIKSAKETIDKFIDSTFTEGITDFYEQVKRTGGFPDSAMYILPEKEARYICINQGEYSRFFYPINTVYFNYYVKGDELGNQVIEAFDEETFLNDFYYSLKREGYRNDKYSELADSGYMYDERNIYNVVKIPEIQNNATTSIEPTS